VPGGETATPQFVVGVGGDLALAVGAGEDVVAPARFASRACGA
jgi:hypothetical protein